MCGRIRGLHPVLFVKTATQQCGMARGAGIEPTLTESKSVVLTVIQSPVVGIAGFEPTPP